MRKHQMRTTPQLDDDGLAAARVLARKQRTSLGAVISELARQALVAPAPGSSSGHQGADHRNGLPLLPWKEKGAPVDLELMNNLRDELAQARARKGRTRFGGVPALVVPCPKQSNGGPPIKIIPACERFFRPGDQRGPTSFDGSQLPAKCSVVVRKVIKSSVSAAHGAASRHSVTLNHQRKIACAVHDLQLFTIDRERPKHQSSITTRRNQCQLKTPALLPEDLQRTGFLIGVPGQRRGFLADVGLVLRVDRGWHPHRCHRGKTPPLRPENRG